ncbi:MAG: cytidine deaminase [bacterium]
MDKTTRVRLIKSAQNAARRAYAPYSHFPVGAAVISNRKRVYAGANVENASYGLTVCAERIAILKAVTAGERKIEAIAVFTETENLTPPCGACLQVLSEFSTNPIVILASRRNVKTFRLRQLLPIGFRLNDSL